MDLSQYVSILIHVTEKMLLCSIKRVSFSAALCLCTAVISIAQPSSDPISKYREAAHARWEKEIVKLETLDKNEQDPDHAILFIGSSSIRRWETIARDMAPWPTIRRGYGGAKFSDLAVFINRIVDPHQFDALVIFVGNDITGKDTDQSPEEVVRLFQYVVERVRTKHARQPIFLVAVTPNSSRFHAWPRVEQMHQRVKQFIDRTDGVYFIETANAYLGDDGKPNDALFVNDKLHLNEEGYRVWARLIQRELAKVLGKPTAS